METSCPIVIPEESNIDEKDVSTDSKQSDNENVDAIKKFIEEQDKALQENVCALEPDQSSIDVVQPLNAGVETKIEVHEIIEESIPVKGNVMEMIVNQSEAEMEQNSVELVQNLSQTDKGNNSMALSIGSKVEAKDFREDWYLAQIMEVDYDEMEVLVHYECNFKKHDEWISVSSPRLRPAGSGPVKTGPSPEEINKTPTIDEQKDVKIDEKGKLTYAVGERCLARWRDNRRFMATIKTDLGDDKYEIVFDDGCLWTCNTTRLYKMKPGKDNVVVNASASPTASPGLYGAGPSSNVQASTPLPAYHTHLFDPTRDYLGSKSERRERKRKLNIKEIFNIGQKKQRTPKTPKENMPRKPVEKKGVKLEMKLIPESEMKVEVKSESTAADAVASIIGTINQESAAVSKTGLIQLNELIEPKKELTSGADLTIIKDMKDIDNVDEMDVDDPRDDLEQVLEEEVRLENFDKQDTDNHEEVLAMMKEVINKLEDGLNQDAKRALNSAKHEIKGTLPILKIPSNGDVAESLVTDADTKSDILPDSVADVTKLETVQTILGSELPKSEAIPDKLEPKVVVSESISEIQLMPENSTTEFKPEEKENVEIITVNPEEAEDSEPTTALTQNEDNKSAVADQIKVQDKGKKLSKVKKSKKLRLLQEKKVKKQVEKVKSELEEMKKQMEEMRKEMMMKTQNLPSEQTAMMPESFLLPGEWCCKWVNGQPVGTVSEMEYELKPEHSLCDKPPLPRRSVQVEDKRLPSGWTKHMVRRSFGNSAGKWDVVLVSPENRRFHTKNEIRNYLENNPDKSLQAYEHALTDFGVHLKLARRMGWITNTPDGTTDGPTASIPAGLVANTSPLMKKKKLGLKKAIRHKNKDSIKKRPKTGIKIKLSREFNEYNDEMSDDVPSRSEESTAMLAEHDLTPLEDGYVYVGSLKVQVIENLLRCPAEGCYKNFRNNTLIQMHIKHYHRELRKMLGATPKVLDLAYARTKTVPAEFEPKHKDDSKIIKVKIPRPPKREEKELNLEQEAPVIPVRERLVPRSQDSPKLRQALNKPVKRPKVLLPVRRPEPNQDAPELSEDNDTEREFVEPLLEVPPIDSLDFETAISTHTVTKPVTEKKRKGDKKRKTFALPSTKPVSEEDDWMAANSDVETRSSFPGSNTPDSKVDVKAAAVSSESNEDKDGNMYMYTETGERIKIVHMKREEIINCHCGFREEDGLMVQCELCLCWQHALCHNIQREADVPEKYTCSICLNPRRGRRSKRFLHDQDRMYEGLLPGAKPCETLRRSHELSGNLLRIEDALHALTVNYYVATKKDHPKLYLWAKDWEQLELQYTQEKLNSDYSDLNIMINAIGKENLPVKHVDAKDLLDLGESPSEEHDRYSQRENQLGSQVLLSGLLSSPSGGSLDLPISTSELERLAKTVEEQEPPRPVVTAPQPEAAIENSVCRERLLKHIQRCQALIDSRLDSIEAQVAELESQDPSFEDDETADYFPRTKQTVQMLMRDLDTMEELGVIT